jgi:hypothetical protein
MGWWKSLQTDWRKFRHLSAQEVGMLLEVISLLPLTRLALYWLGFRRWQTTLARFSSSPRLIVLAQDNQCARRAARCVTAAASRLAPGDTCLSQALVLWWLLRRRGLDCHLRLGVRKDSDRLMAHAWIEYRGIDLGPRPVPGMLFVPFSAPIIPSGRQSA